LYFVVYFVERLRMVYFKVPQCYATYIKFVVEFLFPLSPDALDKSS
jgi:hypothetical protein